MNAQYDNTTPLQPGLIHVSLPPSTLMSDQSEPRKRPPASGHAFANTPAGQLPEGVSIATPMHTFFTSPARSHPDAAQAKELPLHLIHLILSHVCRRWTRPVNRATPQLTATKA